MARPDQLAPLIANATSEVRTARPGTVQYQDAEGRFIEGCPKCRGTGQTRWGACFKCKGKGKLKFVQPAEQRARNKVSTKALKARKADANVVEFKAAHPEMYAWLEARKDRWNVAREILADIPKYGDGLHEGRMNFIRAKMEQDTARDASYAIQRADNLARAPIADTAGVDRLKAAFDFAAARAADKGRKFSPRLTIGEMVISPAKATGANPGALYVKSDRIYLGKVIGGKFLASRDCKPEQTTKVLAFIADPADAARKYGQEFGICCVCNARLTNEESMTRGMGPVCAANFGW